MRSRTMKTWLSLVAGVWLALAAATAQAIPTVKITDGTNTFEIADNSPGDGNSVAGLVDVNQPFGPWSVNLAIGITKPLVGSAGLPFMFFNSVQFSSSSPAAPLPLVVSFSDTDYTGIFPGFVTETSGFTDGEVAVASFYDPDNFLFGTTGLLALLGPLSGDFTARSSNALDPNNPLTGPYSLTLAALINHPEGFNTTGLNIELQPVPEPGTVLLLGVGIAGLAGAARWRRKQIGC